MVVWSVPMWFLIDTRSVPLFFIGALGLTAGLGLSYGPQAALYAELFPAKIRYSGVFDLVCAGSDPGRCVCAGDRAMDHRNLWRVLAGGGVYHGALGDLARRVSTIRDPWGVDLNVRDADAKMRGVDTKR